MYKRTWVSTLIGRSSSWLLRKKDWKRILDRSLCWLWLAVVVEHFGGDAKTLYATLTLEVLFFSYSRYMCSVFLLYSLFYFIFSLSSNKKSCMTKRGRGFNLSFTLIPSPPTAAAATFFSCSYLINFHPTKIKQAWDIAENSHKNKFWP